MSNSNLENRVLDTLAFKDGKIFLKKFHAQRTFEALAWQDLKIELTSVQKYYDQLETQYSSIVTPEKILRLVFANNSELEAQVEVLTKSYLPLRSQLQILSSLRSPEGQGEQNFKWSRREFWEKALALKSTHADDLILLNTKNQITETTRCNIFVYDPQDNTVYTPPLSAGCINGVYRRYVMERKRIQLPDEPEEKIVLEKDLTIDDLRNHRVYIANSVREVLRTDVLF